MEDVAAMVAAGDTAIAEGSCTTSHHDAGAKSGSGVQSPPLSEDMQGSPSAVQEELEEPESPPPSPVQEELEEPELPPPSEDPVREGEDPETNNALSSLVLLVQDIVAKEDAADAHSGGSRPVPRDMRQAR